MRFSCHFDYYPAPASPSSFINTMTVDVLCCDEYGHDCLVARLAIDHLDLTRAETAGEDVLMVCDADSGGWEAVYGALFEEQEDFAELRRDFHFEEPIFGVLFLHQSVFHKSVHAFKMFILHHAAGLFGESTALVMWDGQTDLSNTDLARLGFRRIAGHGLLFRPNMLRCSYDAADDAEQVYAIEVSSRVTKDVEAAWRISNRDEL